MIDKKSILKMSEHVFRKSQGYPDRRLMHPQREWGIGILFFILLVVVGAVAAGNVFITYSNADVAEGDSGEAVPQYRDVIVQDALELYRARSEKYNHLREKVVPAVVEIVASSSVEENVPSGIIEDGG